MFYESSVFPFLTQLEAGWQSIRDELLALSETYFVHWPEHDIYTGKWTVFGLYKFGEKVTEHCALCPRTTALIEAIPGLMTAGFSSLAPHTHIRPHVGYTDQVLRCHVGLIVPDGCAIRVGQQTRAWREGEVFVFDDTYEHEAWNRSESPRVVMLLDFKRDADADVAYPEHVLAYEAVTRGTGGASKA